MKDARYRLAPPPLGVLHLDHPGTEIAGNLAGEGRSKAAAGLDDDELLQRQSGFCQACVILTRIEEVDL